MLFIFPFKSHCYNSFIFIFNRKTSGIKVIFAWSISITIKNDISVDSWALL